MLVILWIVARLVLPSMTFVALHCIAVIVRKIADAAYLAIISRIAIDCRSVISLLMRRRVEERRAGEIVTVDRLNRERGVCHAISSGGECVQVR